MAKKIDHTNDTPLPHTPPPDVTEPEEVKGADFVREPMSYAGEPIVRLERMVMCLAINYEYPIFRTLEFPSGAILPYATEAQWQRYLERTGQT